MKKGYELTYNWVMDLLQSCDFKESAKRLNLRLSGDAVMIAFLGRTYAVSKEAIRLAEEKILWLSKKEGYEYHVKSVLGYYLLSEADAEPQNDFCTLAHFSHGIFENRELSGDRLTSVFGADYNKFRKAAEKLSMRFEGEKSSGQYVWSYLLLPKIPIKIVYYEGDEDYPAKVQVLYDKTAILFFKFEPLAVLHGSFIEGFAAVGETEQ
ncbi:MAG: DUF3786 domain-containing protein [Spirochaetaceae bacterium]|nr:DUF3786 domain-containing protein [Spirochaetaceae bacterium]